MKGPDKKKTPQTTEWKIGKKKAKIGRNQTPEHGTANHTRFTATVKDSKDSMVQSVKHSKDGIAKHSTAHHGTYYSTPPRGRLPLLAAHIWFEGPQGTPYTKPSMLRLRRLCLGGKTRPSTYSRYTFGCGDLKEFFTLNPAFQV